MGPFSIKFIFKEDIKAIYSKLINALQYLKILIFKYCLTCSFDIPLAPKLVES